MNVPPISMASVIPRVSLRSMAPDYTAPPRSRDRPFTEAKELISGYWLSCRPTAAGDVLEIRQVSEVSDFGPEVARKEAALLDEIGSRVDENKKRETPASRSSPDEVDDQRNDRDDQEDVNEAPRDVEYEPTEDPRDN